MNSITYKNSELLILFILIPVSFLFNYSPWIKLGFGVFGFAYVIYILRVVEKMTFKIGQNLRWKPFWKVTIYKLILIGVITTLFVWFTNKALLYNVLINNPKLWLFILFVYSVFSVYPQELLYRTFFFKRYASLFKNDWVLILFNAFLFSLGHLFFKNTLVIILTFLGGILFAITYNETKSTLLVSIEHAIYGCWLFTIGMGGMLGFPS